MILIIGVYHPPLVGCLVLVGSFRVLGGWISGGFQKMVLATDSGDNW